MRTCSKLLCLIRCENARKEHYCVLILMAFIIINCFVWGTLDIILWKPEYLWTIWILYIPITTLFSFGIYAYLKPLPIALFIFNIILCIVIIGITGYWISLLVASNWWWALLTIFFIYLLLWILYGTCMEYKDQKAESH